MKKEDLNRLPAKPGVYVMKDGAGAVLYVGKAKNIKKRVSSYWTRQAQQAPKTAVLISKVAKVEPTVASSEVEALVLENELIKKYRPPFNVVMRDDKSYVYIRIPVQEDFPRIGLARKVTDDKAKYFGPFTDGRAVRQTLRLIHKIFPLCTATSRWVGRACLNYHLGICPGVCLGQADKREYQATIHEVIKFLRGDYVSVLKRLREKMKLCSNTKRFEQAARIRDAIRAIEKINERQQVVSPNLKLNQDVVGLARELNKAVILLMQIRAGKMRHQQFFVMESRMESRYESEDAEILAGFLRDYYKSSLDIPKEIILPERAPEIGAFERWLTDLAGRRVDIIVPQRGKNRRMLKLVSSNARLRFEELAGHWDLESKIVSQGLVGLKHLLKLKRLKRVEAYDISNLQGTDAAGSMVVFEDGKMDRRQYRRFKVRSVSGPDDFASLAEVLCRRFKRSGGDKSFASQPDLILIDGGRGQVNTVQKVIGTKIRVVGLAKGSHSAPKAKDDIVIGSRVLVLSNNDPAKMLLQRIRDEAHRFAVGYHASLRRKRVTSSQLEALPGVGAVTRRKLLKAFGSLVAIKGSSESEIARVVGEAKARIIRSQL